MTRMLCEGRVLFFSSFYSIDRMSEGTRNGGRGEERGCANGIWY